MKNVEHLNALAQEKYAPLCATDASLGQPPLPTPSQLRAGAAEHSKQTVRDWWGLVLASVRGEPCTSSAGTLLHILGQLLQLLVVQQRQQRRRQHACIRYGRSAQNCCSGGSKFK